MKKIVYAITAIIIVSCSTEKRNQGVIICGKIENFNDNITLFINDDELKTTCDSSGNFTFRCDTLLGKYYPLISFGGYHSARLFVLPGDSIHISCNDSAFDSTLAFSGSNKEINQYLVSYSQEPNELKGCGAFNIFRQKNKYVYKNLIDSVYNIKKKVNDEFIKSNPDLNEIFKKSHAIDLTLWPYNYYKHHPDLIYETNYDSIVSLYDFNDVDYFRGSEYVSFYYSCLNDIMVKLSKTDSLYCKYTIGHPKKKLKLIDEKLANPIINEHMKFFVLRFEWINNFRVDGIDSCYNAFMASSTMKNHKTELKKQYDKFIRLVKGKPAIEFTCYDNKRKEIKLSSFKGNAMVITFWGYWSPPCIEAIPYMQKLQKEFSTRDVVFIDISFTDSTQSKPWLDMVQKMKMNNLQLCIGSWDNPINEDYGLSTAPYFVLIDKKGIFYKLGGDKPSKEDVAQLLL